jgi:hypothetical protein
MYSLLHCTFYRPRMSIPYIMIVEAPLSEKGIHCVDARLFMQHSLQSISYGIWSLFYILSQRKGQEKSRLHTGLSREAIVCLRI